MPKKTQIEFEGNANETPWLSQINCDLVWNRKVPICVDDIQHMFFEKNGTQSGTSRRSDCPTSEASRNGVLLGVRIYRYHGTDWLFFYVLSLASQWFRPRYNAQLQILKAQILILRSHIDASRIVPTPKEKAETAW